jgi:hypothetical protein
LCGACKEHWRYSHATQQCEKCNDSSHWFESFTLVVVFALLIALLFCIRKGDLQVPSYLIPTCCLGMNKSGGDDSGGGGGVLKKEKIVIHVPFIGMFYHLESGSLKVLWSTFQILQSISFNLSVLFPNPYSTFVGYLAFFELDFISIDCFNGDYLLGVFIASVVPVLLALLCWLVFIGRYFHHQLTTTATKKANTEPPNDPPNPPPLPPPTDDDDDEAPPPSSSTLKSPTSSLTRQHNNDSSFSSAASSSSSASEFESYRNELFAQHTHVSLLIIYVFLPPIANKQFKALNCQELADGQSYLRANTSVDCNSDSYHKFVILDACLIAFYQSLPLLYAMLLFRVRLRLNPHAANMKLALHIRDQDQSLRAFKVYYAHANHFYSLFLTSA